VLATVAPVTTRQLSVLVGLAALLLLSGCGSSASSSSAGSSSSGTSAGSTTTSGGSAPAGQVGFEGVPIETGPALAPASTTQTGTVDGISCGPTEQLAYHIHAHLTVYANGTARPLPGGIGIPGSTTVQTSEGPVAAGGRCIYWLHTHAPDGIIHVESPTQRVYTLGNFFDEWHQPLSSTQVAGAAGKVTAVVNGKPWTGSPAKIQLLPHAVIQLDVGSPVVPFKSMSWSGLQL
jgi:hypothetical protein